MFHPVRQLSLGETATKYVKEGNIKMKEAITCKSSFILMLPSFTYFVVVCLEDGLVTG